MHSSSSRSSSRIYIDITDEDENDSDTEFLAKSKRYLDLAKLRAQVLALQKENLDLRSKLTVTQSELGKAVVANVMQVNYSTTKDDVMPAASSKRPRSPSLELFHTSCTGKGKVKGEIMSPQSKKIKIETSVKTSPSQLIIQMASSPTKPITPKAEPEPFSIITRSHMSLKRPGAGCLSASSDISQVTKFSRPSQSVSASPLISGPSPRRSLKCTSAGEEEKLHMQGGGDSNLLESLKKYMRSAPVLPIHPRPLKVRIKRVPFAEYYGGSSLQFLQWIPAGQNPSGNIKRDLVFPQPQYNPGLPVDPGEPGLIFACRHEVANGRPWTLFVKHDPAVAVWTYLGEYKGEVCGQLTPDQFKTLSEMEKDTWVNLLLTRKSGIYLKMRIRIALRKGGLIPLKDKKMEEELIGESIKCHSDFKVTEEDVRTAFYEGDEVIDLILMTCISYDRVFADDIRRNFTEAGTRRVTVGQVNIQDDSSDDIYF